MKKNIFLRFFRMEEFEFLRFLFYIYKRFIVRFLKVFIFDYFYSVYNLRRL